MANDFFTFNENEAKSGFEPLPVGEYEVVISNAEPKTSTNGNQMIALTLTVREDVAQEGGKRKFFDNLVFQENTRWKVAQFLKALGFKDGHGFAGPEDMVAQIAYKAVRIKNKHEIDNRDNTTLRDRVNYYIPTQHPLSGQAAGPVDPFSQNGGLPDINDDDLPF